MIKNYAVKSKKEYTDKTSGENRHIWLEVGKVTHFDNDSMILELNMFPGQQFAVFPFEKKEAKPESQANTLETKPVPNF